MAVKLFDLKQNQAVNSAGGFTFDPGLRDIVAGVEIAVAPDIIIPIPKQTASPATVTSVLAVGNMTVSHGGAGGAGFNFDILSLRMHTIQRLIVASQAQIANRNVYFIVANGVNLGKGAVYADNADLTRQYTVQVAKAAGDGATVVIGLRGTTGTPEPALTGAAVAGQLNLVSGTGDAIVAFSGRTDEIYASDFGNVAIANGAGSTINPQLAQGSFYVAPPAFATPYAIPDIAFVVAKAAPAAATGNPYVAAALALGNITLQHNEVAPVNCDVFMPLCHSMQRLILQQVGAVAFNPNDTRRYFTILNTANASQGAIYADNADATRTYRVVRAKVSGDGSLLLQTVRILGGTADVTAPVAGQLNLVSGTGDATIATTQSPKFEKYVDVQQNVAVPNGAGLVFNPGLVVNGTPVMPDIVIVMPKAAATVPFVATDLAGAVGNVTVQINGGAPVNCDIVSLRLFSEFRV